MSLILTDDQLKQLAPHCPAVKRQAMVPIVNSTMQRFKLDTYLRASAWLATLMVESGEFRYNEELDSGAAYEGRKDLGNTQPGDGRKFKGHGRIQITGRDAHQKCGDYFGVDLIANPLLLTEEPLATDSAGWFWCEYKSGMNDLADSRKFLATQIKVNGRNKKTGLPNGWEERKAYYERALRLLPEDDAAPQSDTDHGDVLANVTAGVAGVAETSETPGTP